MGSIFAMALLVGRYPALDVEDVVPNSKVNQYLNQVHMKSGVSSGEDKIDEGK